MDYPEKSYYDTLGVQKSATNEQIKRAYREQMKFFHPDVFQGSPEVAELKSKELNEAYSVLIDAVKRASYDEWLSTHERHEQAGTKEDESTAQQQAKSNKQAKTEQAQQEESKEPQDETSENKTSEQNSTVYKSSRWSNATYALFVSCILLIGSIVAMSYSFNSHINKMQSIVTERDKDVAYWKSNANTYKKIALERAEEIEYLEEKSNFFDEQIVIVPTKGVLYHKYDCDFFQNFYEGTYLLMTKEIAENIGYESGCDCTVSETMEKPQVKYQSRGDEILEKYGVTRSEFDLPS